MTTEQKIIDYIGKISRGLAKLQTHHAAAIIDMVLQADSCRVLLQRYNMNKQLWETMRTVNTNPAAIDQLISDSLKRQPVQHCYRYSLYNEANELQGYIFSLNPALI